MMLTPCWPSAGPTGGAGGAAPALIWSLMTAVNRFLGGMLCSPVQCGDAVRTYESSDLRDLVERQLDRCLAAEDRHEHLQLLLLGVDLVDGGGQRGERPVHDGDRLPDLEVDNSGGGRGSPARGGLAAAGARRLGGVRRDEDLDDLVQGQRRGLGRRTDEAGDAGGVADGAPRLVVELHA